MHMKKNQITKSVIFTFILIGSAFFTSCSDDPTPSLQLLSLNSEATDLIAATPATNVNINNNIVASFPEALDPATVTSTTIVLTLGSTNVDTQLAASVVGTTGKINIDPALDLQPGTQYSLTIGAVRSVSGLTHAARTVKFTTAP